MIRILLCDDQAIVTEDLRVILRQANDIEVIGVAENGVDALAAAARHHPDVVLMDLRMPVMNGILATERKRKKFDQDGARAPWHVWSVTGGGSACRSAAKVDARQRTLLHRTEKDRVTWFPNSSRFSSQAYYSSKHSPMAWRFSPSSRIDAVGREAFTACSLLVAALPHPKGSRMDCESLLAPRHHWLHRDRGDFLGNSAARRNVAATCSRFRPHLDAWDTLFSGIWPGAPNRRLSNIDTAIAVAIDVAVLVLLLVGWPPGTLFGG